MQEDDIKYEYQTDEETQTWTDFDPDDDYGIDELNKKLNPQDYDENGTYYLDEGYIDPEANSDEAVEAAEDTVSEVQDEQEAEEVEAEAIAVKEVPAAEAEQPADVDATLRVDDSQMGSKIVDAKEVVDEVEDEVEEVEAEADEQVADEVEATELTADLEDAFDAVKPKTFSDADQEARMNYLVQEVDKLSDDQLVGLDRDSFTQAEQEYIQSQINKRTYDHAVSAKALREVQAEINANNEARAAKFDEFKNDMASYVDSLDGQLQFDMGEDFPDEPMKYKLNDGNKKSMADPEAFIKEFVDDNGMFKKEAIPQLVNAMFYYHNIDKIVAQASSTAKAREIRRAAMESKNIQMDPRGDASSVKNDVQADTRTAYMWAPPTGRVRLKNVD